MLLQKKQKRLNKQNNSSFESKILISIFEIKRGKDSKIIRSKLSKGFTPFTYTEPIDGLANPSNTFIVVDFPAPFGPNIPVTPGPMFRDTFEIPCTLP